MEIEKELTKGMEPVVWKLGENLKEPILEQKKA
jgi:hypothetical protein